LHDAATRFSTPLSTHLMSNFTDSLQGWTFDRSSWI